MEIFRVGGHWYFSGKRLKGWSAIISECVLHMSIHFDLTKRRSVCAASAGSLTPVTFTKRDVNTEGRREVTR